MLFRNQKIREYLTGKESEIAHSLLMGILVMDWKKEGGDICNEPV